MHQCLRHDLPRPAHRLALAPRIWNHPERCVLANRALALAQEPTLRLAGAYHSP